MTRKVLSTAMAVFAAVGVWFPNEVWLQQTLKWVLPASALILLYLLGLDLYGRYCDRAQRFIDRAKRDHYADLRREFAELEKLPGVTVTECDPYGGTITAGIGGLEVPWKTRTVLWLANHRLLPDRVTIALLGWLGLRYRGVAAVTEKRT